MKDRSLEVCFKKEDRSLRPSKRKKRSARAYAMDHLARREMSFHELVARMIKAEYSENEAYEAVEQLRQENLQSDERFVEAYVLSKSRRGDGPNKIRYKIRGKQVRESLVFQEIAKYEQKWPEIALQALRKRYHPSELQDLSKKQKAFQYLLRKGHETVIIYHALNALLEQTEEIDTIYENNS